MASTPSVLPGVASANLKISNCQFLPASCTARHCQYTHQCYTNLLLPDCVYHPVCWPSHSEVPTRVQLPDTPLSVSGLNSYGNHLISWRLITTCAALPRVTANHLLQLRLIEPKQSRQPPPSPYPPPLGVLNHCTGILCTAHVYRDMHKLWS